jgi:hypothetical protein
MYMRDEKELNVSNVTIHATRARVRVAGTNGQMQDTLLLPQPEPLPWYRRIFLWEDLIVANREVKGFVIHPIFASAIVGLIVTLGLSFRSELNWQHDQLVILATQKVDAEKSAQQEHIDRANQESADKAWREKMSNQMAELRLKFDQQRSN